jgi:hypothetical protein
MEVNMSIKPTAKLMSKLLFTGLLILPVLLVACKSELDTVADLPLGLGTTETSITVDSSADDVNEYGTKTNNFLEDTLRAGGSETDSGADSVQGSVSNYAVGGVIMTENIFDSVTTTQLSELEAEGLVYMREEEKLARDVYLVLYNQWGLPLFRNIAGSEQTHMDAILRLLDQYSLTDPAAGQGRGDFTNPVFQSLYEQLVTQGGQSLTDALYVGGVIEELDILDLEGCIADTDEAYIIQVYGNLLAGSENHLRAFVSTLERQTGEIYQSTYLSQEAYHAIVDGAQERGNGNGRRNGENGYDGDSRVGKENSVGNRNGRQYGNGRGGN